MKNILALLCALFSCTCLLSQTDTVYKYYSEYDGETVKDSASYFIKYYQQQNQWFGKAYDAKSHLLKFEGTYTTPNDTSEIGTFFHYDTSGHLSETAEYFNGKGKEKNYFFPNGNRKSWIVYSENGDIQQKGWDEKGNEIAGYITEREARFRGGVDDWRKYLERNLDAQIAEKAGSPVGYYMVKVSFIVNSDGVISDVRAIEVPDKCKPCGGEAERVIQNARNWQPAIQHNKPVRYRGVQTLTWVVEEQ